MSQNVSQTATFRQNQVKALAALIEGKKLIDVAAAAGVNRRTVDRWLKEKEFAAALHEATSGQVRDTVRRRVLLMDRAIDELERILDNPETSASMKLRAVSIIFSGQNDMAQVLEFDQRLSALEGRLV